MSIYLIYSCFIGTFSIGNTLEKYFKTGKVKREDVFIVTKVRLIFILLITKLCVQLWVDKNRPEDVEPTLKKSLSDLKLDCK